MRIGLLILFVFLALGGVRCCTGFNRANRASAACIEFNQTAMNYIAAGRLKDAESTLSGP